MTLQERTQGLEMMLSLFADVLRGIAAEHPGVNIGSYPNTAECEAVQAFRVKLQLESRDEAALNAAMRDIEKSIECIPGS